MTRVVFEDKTIVAALDAIREHSQICDASGRVLGHFVPSSAGAPVIYKGVKSQLSPDERERLLREEVPHARPLSELWDKLRQKYPDEFR